MAIKRHIVNTTIYLSAYRQFSGLLLVQSLLEALGVLWVLIELSSFFFESFGESVRPYWWAFMLGGLIFGTYRAVPRLTASSRVQGTDSFIELRIIDMFSVRASYVIACNRTFDTSLEDGIISPESTQGQFTKRFYADSRGELDSQICRSVDTSKGIQLDRNDKPYGKRIQFPVGTIAKVSRSDQTAYLVAISSLNLHRTASASTEDLLDALPRTWEYIRSRGDLGPVCCPILGSGFSRVRATREDLIREIIRSFVSACRAGRFCEKLTVAIAPADYRSGRVNLETLRRFLEHECLYPAALSTDSDSTPKGSPV